MQNVILFREDCGRSCDWGLQREEERSTTGESLSLLSQRGTQNRLKSK